MLSCLRRIRLFVTLWTVACQAPLSVGFSRQEYWSGQPRPPPMQHACYAVLGLVAQSCLTLYCPIDCSPPGSFVHGDSSDKNTGVGCHALLQGVFPTQESNPGLLHCRQILYHLRYRDVPRSVYIYTNYFTAGSLHEIFFFSNWLLSLIWLTLGESLNLSGCPHRRIKVENL